MDMIKDLHELCETIGRAINTSNEKIRTAGGKVTSADMDYVDKLTHSLKSVKAIIKMIEDEEMDDGASYGDRAYRMRGYSRNDGSYMWNGGGYSRMPDDGSYARGRGRYANRDSMGRYSSNGGSYGGSMVDELRELMNDAPDEQTRQEMQRLIQKMENR